MSYDNLWTVKSESIKKEVAVTAFTYEQLMEIGNLISNVHEQAHKLFFTRFLRYPLSQKKRVHGEILTQCRDRLSLLEAAHD